MMKNLHFLRQISLFFVKNSAFKAKNVNSCKQNSHFVALNSLNLNSKDKK